MNPTQRGQAAVEYLFVLVFMVLISSQIVSKFNNFFKDSLGNLAHELSVNLLVGICEKQCYYSAYRNGYKGTL